MYLVLRQTLEIVYCSSTTANTSKEIVAYSDFPPPKEWPNYLHNKLIWQYLNDYAEKFGLKKYIRWAHLAMCSFTASFIGHLTYYRNKLL